MQTEIKIPETEKESVSLSEAVDINILEPDKVDFYHTAGGFTGLRYCGEDYPRIILRRALPIGNPAEYLSVADRENKEIGIIRAVYELPEKQQALVMKELESRYYCPMVYEVKSVRDKLGYVYFELRLGREGDDEAVRYDKSCAVKDVSRNIRMLDENRLIIFDVDGNRYIVPSLSGLDKKSLRRLEPYLF